MIGEGTVGEVNLLCARLLELNFMSNKGKKKAPERAFEFYVRKKGMVRLFIYYQNTVICE